MQEILYKAIKYIRLSDADDKPGESDSVANQRKLIDEYLKNHPEIEVVGEKVGMKTTSLIQFNYSSRNFILGVQCQTTKTPAEIKRGV